MRRKKPGLSKGRYIVMRLSIRPSRAILALLAALAAATASPALARAAPFVPPPLDQAAASAPGPQTQFDVIVLGTPSATTDGVVASVRSVHGVVRNAFQSIPAVEAKLTGTQLLALAADPALRSITPNGAVRRQSVISGHLWPLAADVAPLWRGMPARAHAPAIAIVDSGIDAWHSSSFGLRVVKSLDFTGEARPFSDLVGHGTLVAGLAAGASWQAMGAAPTAPLVSLRVVHSDGTSTVADVLAACDWIDANRVAYDIGVANFSLASAFPDYAMDDPLDAAVDRLWLDGVVVVTAAGNTGPGRMLYAPASDPLAITVGASDIADTVNRADDGAAPWTSFGATAEGFAKPEVAAPGRWMIGPLAGRSAFASEFSDRIVSPGFFWASGTSFAAPIVAGVAEQILARHPDWTPDQVKGALMVTATVPPAAPPLSLGAGEIDGAAAAAVASPPNPNAGLDALLTVDGAGRPAIDWGAWQAAVAADPGWTTASWTDMSWTDMSWTDMSWTDASWADMSWTDASWTDMSWTDMSWTDMSWTDATGMP